MTLYSSTRGQVKNLVFEETVMMGLADDGGFCGNEASLGRKLL